jgi:DNA ligase 1
MKQFRLMKPADLKGSIESLKLPIYATPKFDGIRFGTKETEGKVSLFSNSLKAIQNSECQRLANQYLTKGLDGEIILLDFETARPLPFYQTSSYVMSEAKTLKEHFPWAMVAFKIFDSFVHPDESFRDRFRRVQMWSKMIQPSLDHQPNLVIEACPLECITTPEQALEVHQNYIDLGYEGTVFRSIEGTYKYNRSTLKEQFSLKLKPFEDAEAVLVEVEPYYENLNESELNERGYKEKSKTLADRVEKPWVGAMIVDSPEFGKFKIGTGFNQQQRKEFWDNQESLIGSLVKFKFMRGGSKEKPRHPVFLGFRNVEDL